jgi:cytoskeletal protein RodZ
MTARHQLRFGSRRIGRDRAVIDATPAPSVGEMLYAARERKGVDLYRAERDTKIRLKYLEAMEDGAYDELPPPVYTKGFLRNYALYLGLSPDEVITRWREESMPGARRQEKVVVAPPPQPLAAPRRGVALSPNMLVALMLFAGVALFIGFIGWQVFRFLQLPALGVTQPAALVTEVDAERYTFAGTAGPSSEVQIQGPDGRVYTTEANDGGRWSAEVELSKGRNDFTIVATDPETGRPSDPVQRTIMVPLPATSPSPSLAPTQSAITLTLTSPTSGTTASGGSVTVSGTTSGTRITIDARAVVPPGASPSPSAEPTAAPTPGGSPSASPSAQVLPLDITVPAGGAFSETLQLAAGEWEIVVTAYATGLASVEQTRMITVQAGGVVGEGTMTLVITAQGGASWMRIIADGVVLPGRQWNGPTLEEGETATISANTEIYIRTGNAGVLQITLNGVDLGRLGRRGEVGNWIFEPGQEPRQTTESR